MQTETIGDAVLETWSIDEVAQAWNAGKVVLIDVRTPQEYMLEHVDGSLLMPMAFFRADKLPDQGRKRLVLMCAGGVRSDRMARIALEAGFDRIAHLEGGFGAWKSAKLPYIGTDMATGAPKPVGR